MNWKKNTCQLFNSACLVRQWILTSQYVIQTNSTIISITDIHPTSNVCMYASQSRACHPISLAMNYYEVPLLLTADTGPQFTRAAHTGITMGSHTPHLTLGKVGSFLIPRSWLKIKGGHVVTGSPGGCHHHPQCHQKPHINYRLILGLHPANKRRRYKVTPSLIGWAQT